MVVIVPSPLAGEGGSVSRQRDVGEGAASQELLPKKPLTQFVLVGSFLDPLPHASIGLDPKIFGTHSLRRTKATLIYKRTGNLRAVQLLLGHTKIESTARYLGVEIDDALRMSEQVDL